MTDGAQYNTTRTDRWLTVMRARELFSSLLKARRAIDRFPNGHRQRRASLGELARCARRVLDHGPLTVQLKRGNLWLDEAHLLDDCDGLCGDLTGVGLLELTLTDKAAPHGVLGLADLCAHSTPAGFRRAGLEAGKLPGVHASLLR